MKWAESGPAAMAWSTNDALASRLSPGSPTMNEATENIFQNIPPRSSRYPGTLLMTAQNIHWEAVPHDAAFLERNANYELRSDFSRQVSAGSALEGSLIEAITRGVADAVLSIEVDPGRVVSASLASLQSIVKNSPLKHAIDTASVANVIYGPSRKKSL
jgi:hypothetical protein